MLPNLLKNETRKQQSCNTISITFTQYNVAHGAVVGVCVRMSLVTEEF